MTAAASTRILLNVNLFLTILGFILYIAAFASNSWVVDDSSNYALWKKSERNNVTGDDICTTIDVSNIKDYFETTRALQLWA
ncbi:hypothetical protein V1264_012446 [Littorina saxatilis]|uniref:Uncharacterized protein n=1 Tax=Littorina saxatilis TaxID=31220 RepID=A0AAN9C1Z4_9CAEN